MIKIKKTHKASQILAFNPTLIYFNNLKFDWIKWVYEKINCNCSNHQMIIRRVYMLHI